MLSETVTVELGLKRLPVSGLLLDNQNPRLSPEAVSYSQNELYSLFHRDFDLFPIARSMADNGYFEEEPLIGIPGPDDKIIIVEGNRRLAALKFLIDPEIRKLSNRRDNWGKLYEESQKKGHDLTVVPVVVHEKREELRAILGFRHITGTMKWDALAKARFVDNLIEERKDADFYNIGREVGTRQDTIRRNYAAYRVHKQAKDDFNIDTSKLESSFGVFYTALNDPGIREYIGLDIDKSVKKLKKPIPRSKADELKNLIGYVHGTKEIEPVFTDSRNIHKLAEILASPEARKLLHATRDFELAYRSTGLEEKTLIFNLESANISLTEAYKTVFRHCENKRVIKLVEQCFGTMDQILRSFPKIRQKLTPAE